MEILKFDGGKSPKNRNKLVTAIAGAFFVAAVGSTFAANITLNTNNTLEYGQGLTTAAACNTSMTITPTNHYVNGANSTGTFYIDTITVTDTPTANGVGMGKCLGKTLKISAWDSVTGSSALLSCSVTLGSTWANPMTGTIANVTNCGTGVYTGLATGFQIAFPNPASAPNKLAGDVYKITIESN